MTSALRFAVAASLSLSAVVCHAQDSLPFRYDFETFQQENDPEVKAFVLRLNQPFLAEEFEKSNYIRLKAQDSQAFLIYPTEARFEQRYAEFYGRLKGDGEARVEISYEVVSENADGTRRIESRNAILSIDVPQKTTGSDAIYKSWARKQNEHFAGLLEFYPDETFFEYLLLQSRDRYGIQPPTLPRLKTDGQKLEEQTYHIFSGGLQVQNSLQRSVLMGRQVDQDRKNHVSNIKSPQIKSANYEALLEGLLAGGEPQVSRHPAAALIPDDQYLVHFNSWASLANLRKANQLWIEPLYRIMAEDAQDHHLISKYESQLGVRLQDLETWFSEDVVSGLTLTGSDFSVAEGTDVTLILECESAEAIETRLQTWIKQQKEEYPDAEDRIFNYRGVQIQARYTASRAISSFAVNHGNFFVVSNSHVGIRRVVDTIQERIPALSKSADYQYVTALHPPSDEEGHGYVYASDAFMRYLFSPSFKIGERRRKESMNHLVMLNNASLFWRLEYGTTPESLEQLIEGRFIRRNQLICPQGGAYSFDASTDSSVNSVFNRIKYLTPIRELSILKVSDTEVKEYERYRKRYESQWREYFSPMALRFSAADDLNIDYCLLPFQNSRTWAGVRQQLAADANRSLRLSRPAASTVASVDVNATEDSVQEFVRDLPGVNAVLDADPTLTDLQWLGDRVSLNFSDTSSILEIDPLRLQPQAFPVSLSKTQQLAIAASLFALDSPAYMAIEVNDQEKSNRFLKLLTTRVFLQDSGQFGPLSSSLDSYQLPDYRDHSISVVTYQLYAFRLRLYLAAVGNELVIATRPGILREVIDAAKEDADDRMIQGQIAVQIRPTAMKKLREDLRVYWEERARRASHSNIMPIYTLISLYDVGIDEIDRLSDAKYGVTYFCPDGEYTFDQKTEKVQSTVYGNRQNATQYPPADGQSSFAQAFGTVESIQLTLDVSEVKTTGTITVNSTRE